MFLADLALTRAGDRLKELVTYPELEQAVGDQYVAGAAAEVLANAHLLVADTDQAVAGHRSRYPLFTIALWPRLELSPDNATIESCLRCGVGERLVRTLCVVEAHPLIQCLLCAFQVAEHLPGVE